MAQPFPSILISPLGVPPSTFMPVIACIGFLAGERKVGSREKCRKHVN